MTAIRIATVVGLLTGVALLFGRAGAIGVAVVAACYLARELVRAVEDGRRARDERRAYRDAVWQRRIDEIGAIRGGRDPWWLHELSDAEFERWAR